MPRFYFHLENAASPIRDTEGMELDDLESAKCHAVMIIAKALCDHPKGFWEVDTYQITVTDRANLTLFLISMMSVIAPALQ